jgi:hypothetical protein
MAHIIMIHGSWSGGWMWDRVVPMLIAAEEAVTSEF